MGMHSFGQMTERQQKRLYFMKELGCMACYKRFGASSPGGEGHHAEDAAGRAIDHDHIIVLCDWHHQCKPPQGYSSARALLEFGPSRHRHAVAFAEEFGTDLDLFAEQRQRLDAYLSTFVVRPNV